MGSEARASKSRSRVRQDQAKRLPAQAQAINLPLELIDASASNPRQRMREVDELAASIAAHGLLQAVVVRPDGDRYVVVAGHRRLAAVTQLGWTHVAATVREVAPDEAYLLTLIENLQRSDLSPREEARALEVLVRENKWSTRQVAAAVYRSPAYISKRLRVFDDPVLAPMVLQRQLSTSAAEELLVLDPRRRRDLARQAVREGWDHPQVRQAVRSRFDSKQRRRVSGLAHDLREGLQGVSPSQLSDSERRELRLLFHDLAVIARAAADKTERVFPKLPE
jgi:ParB/RepB/Spo0J family partition protein